MGQLALAHLHRLPTLSTISLKKMSIYIYIYYISIYILTLCVVTSGQSVIHFISAAAVKVTESYFFSFFFLRSLILHIKSIECIPCSNRRCLLCTFRTEQYIIYSGKRALACISCSPAFGGGGIPLFSYERLYDVMLIKGTGYRGENRSKKNVSNCAKIAL